MLLLRILLIIIIALLLICLIVGYGTMRYVIYPKRRTYEEVEQIEKSKNNWGDYDNYEKEEWNIKSFDGYLLHGILIKNNSNKYVIVTHGYTYNMLGSIKYANIYYKLGYNVYIYDLRHFGKNQKCFCSMGQYESRDIIAVQEAMFQRFGDDITIGLHGESLGCASSMLALGLSQRFEFFVADCGFVNLKKLLSDLSWKVLHLPSFMVFFTDFWMVLLHHYRFSEICPIDVLEKNKVPILFFHGADDDFIIPSHTKQAFEACKAYKQMYIIEGAKHAQSYEKDPVGYEEKMRSFLAHLNNIRKNDIV